MIHGLTQRLLAFCGKFSMPLFSREDVALAPSHRLSGLTRRAALGSMSAAAIMGAVNPAMAGWQIRVMNGTALAGLVGRPGIDYAVGRASNRLNTYKAVAENNRVDNIAVTDGTFVFPNRANNAKVTFTIDRTVHPYDFQRADPLRLGGAYAGDIVTLVLMSSIGGPVNSLTYVNGRVTDWVTTPGATTGLLTIQTISGFYGVGGLNKAGGVSSLITGGGNNLTASTNSSTSNYAGAWSMTCHTAPCLVMGVGIVPYAQASDNDNYVLDWDFGDMQCVIGASTPASSYNKLVAFEQCAFELANMPYAYLSAFISTGSAYGVSFKSCSFPYTWRRYGLTATVLADAPAGSTAAISIDQDFSNFTTNPQPKPPGSPANSIGYIGGQGATATSYRVVNLTNPTSLYPINVNTVTSNSVTLSQYTGGGGAGVSPTSPIRATVKAGDQLMFFPDTQQTVFNGGGIASMDLCAVDVVSDFYRTNPGPLDWMLTRTVVNMMGFTPNHDDFLQLYGWGVRNWIAKNVTVYWGAKKGDELYAPVLRNVQPDVILQGGELTGWDKTVLLQDFTIVCPTVADAPANASFPAAYDYKLGALFRVGPKPNAIITGVRANDKGNARVSFPGWNNSALLASGSVWRILNTGTALDGNKIAQPQVAGVPDYLNLVPSSAIGQTSLYLGGFTASGGSAAVGDTAIPFPYTATTNPLSKGMMLYLGTSPITKLGAVAVTPKAGDTSIQLDAPLTVAVPSGTAFYTNPFIDTNIPFSSLAAIPDPVWKTGLTFSKGVSFIPVDTTGISNGMAVNSLAPSSNWTADYYSGVSITLIPDETYVQVVSGGVNLVDGSGNPVVTLNPASNRVLNFGWAIKPRKTGLLKGKNIACNNWAMVTYAGLADAMYNPQALGDSISGITDLNLNPVPFYMPDPNGFVAPSAKGIYAWMPDLPAPPNLSLVAVPGGYVATFDAVAGANGYAYSLDGVLSLVPNNDQAPGLITSGQTITGLTPGSSFGVVALNAVNDIGIPVNPGALSALVTVPAAA